LFELIALSFTLVPTFSAENEAFNIWLPIVGLNNCPFGHVHLIRLGEGFFSNKSIAFGVLSNERSIK
jgi:hypothetical protein